MRIAGPMPWGLCRSPAFATVNSDKAIPDCFAGSGLELKTNNHRIFMAYELPPLPYPKEALEPTIDAATMEIHHDKHHAAYVTNVNKAIAGKADLGIDAGPFAFLADVDIGNRLERQLASYRGVFR